MGLISPWQCYSALSIYFRTLQVLSSLLLNVLSIFYSVKFKNIMFSSGFTVNYYNFHENFIVNFVSNLFIRVVGPSERHSVMLSCYSVSCVCQRPLC